MDHQNENLVEKAISQKSRSRAESAFKGIGALPQQAKARISATAAIGDFAHHGHFWDHDALLANLHLWPIWAQDALLAGFVLE